jgi:hypothetical protein
MKKREAVWRIGSCVEDWMHNYGLDAVCKIVGRVDYWKPYFGKEAVWRDRRTCDGMKTV